MKMRDLKKAAPGGGTDRSAAASDIISSLTVWFAVLAAVVLLVIALSGIRIVKSGEVALVLRFGKLCGTTPEEQIHEPGLLLAFPYIIDEVVTVPVGSVMKLDVTTHYTPTHMTGYSHNGYVITGDRNLIIISASVQYVISDPVAYTLNIDDGTKLVTASVSSAMSGAAAPMSAEELLTSGKLRYSDEVLRGAQELIDGAGAGITLKSVELTSVSMPFEVKDMYDAVNSAKVSAATKLENAALYRGSLIPSAEAKADTLVSAASSEKAAAVAAANSYLSEFYGVLDEYGINPEKVRTRIYNEKIAAMIGAIGTVKITDGNSDSRIVIGGKTGG